jgi:hypothetical protein
MFFKAVLNKQITSQHMAVHSPPPRVRSWAAGTLYHLQETILTFRWKNKPSSEITRSTACPNPIWGKEVQGPERSAQDLKGDAGLGLQPPPKQGNLFNYRWKI